MAFCLSLCLLFALTYQEWLVFDVSQSVDPKTYWGLAHFDFEQSVVRKYRVIVPFLAAGLNWLMVSFAHLFKPGSLSGDFSMRLSFYMVNLASGAAWCTLTYAYLRAMDRSKVASLVGLLMVATSYWTVVNTYAFMTDSFYCCFVALTFLGIARKNATMLFWAILIGPFAKEAYVFLLPVIFLYSHVHKGKLLLWFFLSGIVTFSYRYLYDHITGHTMMESLGPDMQHFTYISNLVHRFIEPDYMNPLLATIGLWIFIPAGALLFIKGFARQCRQSFEGYMLLWLLLVLLQMVTSGDLARMFYTYLPIYGFFVALAVDAWRSAQRSSSQ